MHNNFKTVFPPLSFFYVYVHTLQEGSLDVAIIRIYTDPNNGYMYYWFFRHHVTIKTRTHMYTHTRVIRPIVLVNWSFDIESNRGIYKFKLRRHFNCRRRRHRHRCRYRVRRQGCDRFYMYLVFARTVTAHRKLSGQK